MATITTSTIIRAVGDLHGDVTADQIAKYLRVPTAQVRPLLKELKDRRLLRDARKDGDKVWSSW